MKKPFKQLVLSSFILISSFIITYIAYAESKTLLPQGENRINSTDINSENKTDINYANESKKIIEQTALIDKNLEIKEREIAELSTYLEDIRNRKTEFESQTNVYKIEMTTFGSQLPLPDVDTKLLEKAYMSSQAAVAKLTTDISKLREKNEQLKQGEQIAYEQKMGNDKFLIELKHKGGIENNITSRDAKQQIQPKQDIKSAVPPLAPDQQQSVSFEKQLALGKYGDPQQRAAFEQRIDIERQHIEEQKLLEKQKVVDEQKIAEEQKTVLRQLQIRLRYLQTAITKQMLLMQSTHAIINGQIPVLEDIGGKYKTLVGELEVRIRDSKKAELLTRKTNPLTQGTWKRMGEDIRELLSIATSIFELESWKNSFSFLWLSGLHKLISFIVILLIFSIITIRFKILLKRICYSSPHLENRYWSRTVLEIFGRNLLLSAVTAFFYLCIKFKLFFSYSIVGNLIVEILMILIFILWTIYFLENIQKRYPVVPVKELILFLKTLNMVSVIYILLGSALKSDSSIVIGYRLLCEIIFYGWLIYFLKKLMPEMIRYCEKKNKTIQMIPIFYKNGVVLAAITGIVLELLGYGTLAFYWYISWGKTVVVIMWSGLIIGASGEWMPAGIHTPPHTDNAHIHLHAKNSFSVLWLIKNISFIVLFFLVTIALMLSWASSDFVFPWLYKILTFKFLVGSMSFSISSIAQAIMILVITHFFARAWRNFFQQHLLGDSGLDHGLQESMTTITVYAIWIFGIFTSLIVFGLNTTTLTVAFGALSIGIGFGLQNIVSNFISGIILLFERPIQVGDDIEVGGVWATVKKTNVRSTIVQTYDNATIIIPNSELISNRVTNWSFKDRRLRRKIKVGVEYGSDVELVKKTLIEIAGRAQRVLKFPEPDVLFEDFGDSALIFSLRFWTFTDYFMPVETDIRFRIEKMFKEKGIVMAFPQQDIHIRSMPNNLIVREDTSIKN